MNRLVKIGIGSLPDQEGEMARDICREPLYRQKAYHIYYAGYKRQQRRDAQVLPEFPGFTFVPEHVIELKNSKLKPANAPSRLRERFPFLRRIKCAASKAKKRLSQSKSREIKSFIISLSPDQAACSLYIME